MPFGRFAPVRTWLFGCCCVALAASAPALAAPGDRGGEFGIQFGFLLPDKDLSGRSGKIENVEPLFGIRGTLFTAAHWGWFVDASYSDFPSALDHGDIVTYAARTGFELLSAPHWEDYQTFLNVGGGWSATELESGEEFDRSFVSLGLGQRFAVGSNTLLRWELRADHTLNDDGLDGRDLTTSYGLIGLTWGVPNRAADADGDGVADRRDLCPGTPVGAHVDDRGCPLDGDGDGVLDGLDRCPDTPAGWPVDAAGCSLDGDGDGVADGADRCPDTPYGTQVDAEGCPLDSDADGVDDATDRCPDTPAGARVDVQGCPLDGDDDGVFDGLDRCPDTPRFAHVDAQGCPLDGDGDGVFDGLDRCPESPAGELVNAFGCPREAPLFEEDRRTLVLDGVYFEVNQARLTPNSESILDRVARSLLDWPDVRVEIGGHTDSSGRDAYNLELSERRAAAVRDYLVAQGIEPARLTSRGYGETRPIADNGSDAGRSRNRRVELTRLD